MLREYDESRFNGTDKILYEELVDMYLELARTARDQYRAARSTQGA